MPPRRRNLPFFDAGNQPVALRIASGLAKVGIALKQQAWQAAGERGLSPTQGQILTTLATRDNQRPSEIAEVLGVTLATTSVSIGALVDKGLVEKMTDPRDARSTLVRLTSAGAREAGRAMTFSDFLASAVEVMSPSEQAVFLTGLIKMIRTLQERGQIPIARMCVSCVYFRPHAHADAEKPHHCAFVDAPMAAQNLRIDCFEHEEADAETRARAWARFIDDESSANHTKRTNRTNITNT